MNVETIKRELTKKERDEIALGSYVGILTIFMTGVGIVFGTGVHLGFMFITFLMFLIITVTMMKDGLKEALYVGMYMVLGMLPVVLVVIGFVYIYIALG